MPKKVADLIEIGIVKEVDDDISTIEVHPEFSDALYRIETKEYLDILFWIPLSRDVHKVHPRGDVTRPIRGVFSTRSPARPNNIGVTQVRLLGREGNIIKVRGLDAYKGTSIIDIKSGRRKRNGEEHR